MYYCTLLLLVACECKSFMVVACNIPAFIGGTPDGLRGVCELLRSRPELPHQPVSPNIRSLFLMSLSIRRAASTAWTAAARQPSNSSSLSVVGRFLHSSTKVSQRTPFRFPTGRICTDHATLPQRQPLHSLSQQGSIQQKSSRPLGSLYTLTGRTSHNACRNTSNNSQSSKMNSPFTSLLNPLYRH